MVDVAVRAKHEVLSCGAGPASGGGAAPAPHDGEAVAHGVPVSVPPLCPAVGGSLAGKGVMNDEAKMATNNKIDTKRCCDAFCAAPTRQPEYQVAVDRLAVASVSDITAERLFQKGHLAWLLHVGQADAGV